MAVTLRSIYEGLSWFSTASHIAMCDDFLRKIRANGDENLARLFSDAVRSNSTLNLVNQCFLDEDLIRNRTPLTEFSRGTNRVTYIMSNTSDIALSDSLFPYSFQYVEREVPHLRAETLIEQDDKGWIDYIAKIEGTPILGEIKYKSDQNPFYAFIQLITYLSEMATENQIERAINHQLFGDSITDITSFDLHILLANFNDRGEKGPLIESTFELARMFKIRLINDYPELANLLRHILCISASINDGEQQFADTRCLWRVE